MVYLFEIMEELEKKILHVNKFQVFGRVCLLLVHFSFEKFDRVRKKNNKLCTNLMGETWKNMSIITWPLNGSEAGGSLHVYPYHDI